MIKELSKTSLDRLKTCDLRLQSLVLTVNATFPVRVLCGHRGEVEQNAAVKAGASKTPWPKSKHNSYPSKAVDLLPEKLVSFSSINWNNKKAFEELAEEMFFQADKLGIHIRWGGDFQQDGSKTKKDSWDLPHYEIVEK